VQANLKLNSIIIIEVSKINIVEICLHLDKDLIEESDNSILEILTHNLAMNLKVKLKENYNQNLIIH
jgi:hypothetical protein